jgi:choline transport protein
MRQAAHMAEEVRNASKVIPKTILVVYVLNFVLMFPAILTVCYHIPNLDDALSDPTTYPAIYVLRQSMSTTWITVVLAVIVVIMCVSSINYFAAVTRDLFAFARDQGLPFSSWLGKVHPTKHLPVNASQVSSVIAGLLSLIYIGSPVAFYAITSLLTVSLLMCYILSIGSMLWRKVYRPHTITPSLTLEDKGLESKPLNYSTC